jgi:hypothetical protein
MSKFSSLLAKLSEAGAKVTVETVKYSHYGDLIHHRDTDFVQVTSPNGKASTIKLIPIGHIVSVNFSVGAE